MKILIVVDEPADRYTSHNLPAHAQNIGVLAALTICPIQPKRWHSI